MMGDEPVGCRASEKPAARRSAAQERARPCGAIYFLSSYPCYPIATSRPQFCWRFFTIFVLTNYLIRLPYFRERWPCALWIWFLGSKLCQFSCERQRASFARRAAFHGHHSRRQRRFLAADVGVRGAGLSRQRRLHGPRQLGDRSQGRRELQI